MRGESSKLMDAAFLKMGGGKKSYEKSFNYKGEEALKAKGE